MYQNMHFTVADRTFHGKTKVYVNEEKRTVVTVIIVHDYKFTGKAKCSPEDEFSLDFGKELSYLRALKQAKKKIANTLYLEDIERLLNNAQETQARIKKLIKGYDKAMRAVGAVDQDIYDLLNDSGAEEEEEEKEYYDYDSVFLDADPYEDILAETP